MRETAEISPAEWTQLARFDDHWRVILEDDQPVLVWNLAKGGYLEVLKRRVPLYRLSAKGRYSPAECIGARKRSVEGDPDPKHVSTSYAERHNLTMRMAMRRFTRLTNAFSKKFENHVHMVALYTVWYNFVRIHKTLRVTPAMAAGVTNTLRDMEWIVSLIDAAAPKPGRHGPYRKQALG